MRLFFLVFSSRLSYVVVVSDMSSSSYSGGWLVDDIIGTPRIEYNGIMDWTSIRNVMH